MTPGRHFNADRQEWTGPGSSRPDRSRSQPGTRIHAFRERHPLKSRCLAEHRCTPVELAALKRFNPSGEHRRESAKAAPERYPSNQDSIGIEIVGLALPKTAKPDNRVYETVNDAQNASLAWLVGSLSRAFGVSMTEVFRHPTVSRKNQTEASTAKWVQ